MPRHIKLSDVLDLEKIEALRHKKNLTQQQAADAARLAGRQQWNAIVQGRQTGMTLTTLAKIATALGVKPKDLMK
jgi:transcriptional regulator with XRE-family HTH domain